MIKITTTVRATESMLSALRPGDRVTIRVPAGLSPRNGRTEQDYAERTGRVVLKFAGHAVLNMGGANGTPGVATEDNIVRVKHNAVRHGGKLS